MWLHWNIIEGPSASQTSVALPLHRVAELQDCLLQQRRRHEGKCGQLRGRAHLPKYRTLRIQVSV
ncbi:BRCA2 and CDKN1A-interacting protein [Apodemus speciosus]|uniref:BRCA2 and CDKN1A-interacting protein n=1 Tax=Apodemus speciosus TaxID=105296 RepID=A0ABQ0F0J5_APOSI